MSEQREMWVVDVETTGLITAVHVPVEVAAVNVRTGEVIEFVPFLRDEDLARAERPALAINRYFERRVWDRELSCTATVNAYRDLFGLLSGQVFGGANPRFDAAMLVRGYAIAAKSAGIYHHGAESWHHRLEDVQSYAAAVMRLPLGDVPSLARVCEFVDVENPLEHSALADARATAECFRRLYARQNAATTTTDEEACHA